MVGIIHQLLFDFVKANWGEAAVGEVRKLAEVPDSTEYRMDTAYPDDEWQRLVGAAIKLSGLPAEAAERAFARFCGDQLAIKMAGFFAGCNGVHDLIRRQPVIHNSMAASLGDDKSKKAVTDKFKIEDKEGETIVHYVSPNRHCTLYRGLAEWGADHYHERIEVTESRCQKKGDPECEIHVKYLGKA